MPIVEKPLLTQKQFETELLKMHDKIYRGRWDNYPHSIFYYDKPDFDGTTNNIGIYSGLNVYSLVQA